MMDEMPMNKSNYETLEDARQEVCEYYRMKHGPVLEPIAQRIMREVEEEIASGIAIRGFRYRY